MGNEVIDSGEFTPRSGETFGCYVQVYGWVRKKGGGISGEGEVLYNTEFSRASLFRYDGEGGGLEWS